jgi:hypothetical protein
MKKNLLIAISLTLAALACKPKKEVASTTPAGPPASPAPPPTEQHLTARARFNDLTMDQLQKGHSIFTGACTNCHAPKNVKLYNDEIRLKAVMDNMSDKAELSASDRDAVWKYAIALRLTK